MIGKGEPLDFDSPRAISAFLAERNIALKKRWGQNFMVNRAAREKIVNLLQPQQDETVWEVGPGLGAMTTLLAPRAGRLVLFEIDWALVHHLESVFAGNSRVRIQAGDVMTTWKKVSAEEGLPAALFGNLPYRSAAVLIGSLLESGLVPNRLVFTVQKEVAGRMAAQTGTANYSGYSVLCQAHCRVRPSGDLAPGAFYPAPEVNSTIVILEKIADRRVVDPALFAGLVRAAFSSRRKKLQNNLLASELARERGEKMIREACISAGVDLSDRAERVSPEKFVALANAIAGTAVR